VSSGAGAAVGICVALGIAVPGAPVVPALLGAAVGGGATLLAVRGAAGPSAVLLIGAAVSAACQALMIAAGALVDSREQGVLVRYLLGSLTGTSWQAVGPAAAGMVVALVAAVAVLPAVNLLRLGDDTASALGLRAGAARMIVLAVASLLVAVVAGPCGPIAWVGFFAVRIVRAWRPNSGAVQRLAWSAVLGALVVVVADVAARTVLYPVELPVGGLTALVAVVVGTGLLLRGNRTTRSSS
jgi:iron complex transport system permease protein